MGTPQGTNQFQVLVEGIARSLDLGQPVNGEDFRQLMTQLQSNIAKALPGGQFVKPGGTVASGAQAPTGVEFSATGANGAINYTITVPKSTQGATIWSEVSYSPLKSFTQSPTTLPPSAGTSGSIAVPGQSVFVRARFSFDLQNWSAYQFASSSAISAGLVSSAATSDAGALNQTNYGEVNSSIVGGTGAVSINGSAGPLTAVPTIKGPAQIALPGSTIVGVPPGATRFAVWDGSGYLLRDTLADALGNDEFKPIGAVSVVGTGTPTLPVVTPIISGGHIIGLNWTPGAGLSSVPTFTVTDPGGSGTGAIVVGTGVEAGALTGMQVLNSGENYDGGTLVTATGGIFPGTGGGGTAIGGNGGRLTAV